VIWEPVLWSDAFRPADRVLARQVPDARGVHYWDPGKTLSQEILRANWTKKYAVRGGPSGVVWDWVACFPAGVRWESEFPEPSEQGFPVVDAAEGVQAWLRLVVKQAS
jgi:hypothetical protein